MFPLPKEERGCRKIIYWGEGTYARETDHAQLDWPARREAAAGSRRTGWLPWVRAEGLCLWEKALCVASSCLQCPSWSIRFMGPDWLSQHYHFLPPQSLGMKKWTRYCPISPIQHSVLNHVQLLSACVCTPVCMGQGKLKCETHK